jgi:acetyl-CoA carboxylase carboxyltransferase component
VNFCDAFEIPVLTLTNVSGYEAGVEEEKQLAKASSEFALALGGATVPKINVILNATGSGYVLMNSKALGADVVYAYEDAKISVMNADSASKIIGGDDLQKTAELFDEKQSALSAARRGYVDELITPETLRKHVLAAFEMLYGKREGIFRKHQGK